MLASVSGTMRRKVVPLPGSLSISMEPFRSSSADFTTSRPTPRPEISVTSSAVLKPGAKISCSASASFRRARSSSLQQSPSLDGSADDFSRSRPRPSSDNFDYHLIALVVRVRERSCRARVFRRPDAFGGRFDAVIGGVADKVSERFGKSVENAFVEIGVLPGDFEADFLVARVWRRHERRAGSGGKAVRPEPCEFSSPIFAVRRGLRD